MSNGQRSFICDLDGEDGCLAGDIGFTEIVNSDAPLLLSLASQEALGLVIDAEDKTITARF